MLINRKTASFVETDEEFAQMMGELGSFRVAWKRMRGKPELNYKCEFC